MIKVDLTKEGNWRLLVFSEEWEFERREDLLEIFDRIIHIKEHWGQWKYKEEERKKKDANT